jgi:hypothetical protein
MADNGQPLSIRVQQQSQYDAYGLFAEDKTVNAAPLRGQ